MNKEQHIHATYKNNFKNEQWVNLKNSIGWKKSNTKEHIQYDSVYMKFYFLFIVKKTNYWLLGSQSEGWSGRQGLTPKCHEGLWGKWAPCVCWFEWQSPAVHNFLNLNTVHNWF
jgi:hypothetical protein